MGNSMGGSRRKKAKVMKINGETFKVMTPVQAFDVIKNYPGYVLLESKIVKQFGIRAKPLEAEEELKPRKLYFLIELPKFPEEKVPRRVRSCVHMSAKDRLESLVLSQRSASDISILRQTSNYSSSSSGPSFGPVQVKMKLPKSRMDKLVEESKDKTEGAQKIIDLYMQNCGKIELQPEEEDAAATLSHQQLVQWNPGVGGSGIK